MTEGAGAGRCVVVRCDALAASGIGHLVRQVALAEELASRGHSVVFRGYSDVAWADSLVAARGWRYERPVDGDDPTEIGRGADLVVIDGYGFSRALGEGLRAAGIPVMAMVDDTFGAHQDADLYVDQNLGARMPEPAHGRWLVGPSYALLRDSVRSRRGTRLAPHDGTPRALVVFGGSDPFRGAPVATQLLLRAGVPVHAVVVAPDEQVADAVRSLPLGEGQSVEVVGRVDDLPGLAVTCDLAVSAAGSTVWELAALRVPTAIMAVVDNQEAGYHAAAGEVAVGLGYLTALREDEPSRAEAVRRLQNLLTDANGRAALAVKAAGIIDGDGRVRVADALEELAH